MLFRSIFAAQHPEAVLGTFRVSDSDLVAEYADGRNDRLWREASGALALRSALPDGRSFCTRWYAEGHQFSTAEREAALNEYAKQLGVSRKGAPGAQDCIAVALENGPGAAKPADGKRRWRAPSPRAAKTALLVPAETNEPIEVRIATVRPIDPLPAADAAGLDQERPLWPAVSGARAATAPQSCLSIEPENGSWGFQNRCGYEVQFAYCVQGMASRSCDTNAHSGAVPANAFAGLFAESEAGNAEYGFRWIVCKGASADVEPRLIRAEPPAGECRNTRAGSVLLAAKMHAP